MKKNPLPISPHLQIYKPQITSVLSITHRITGFCLNLSLIFLILWLFSFSLGETSYNSFIDFLNTIPAKVIIFFSILGFFYHMLNGIRHMIWDLGFFLENKSSAILGYVVIFFSLIISLFVSFKLEVI